MYHSSRNPELATRVKCGLDSHTLTQNDFCDAKFASAINALQAPMAVFFNIIELLAEALKLVRVLYISSAQVVLERHFRSFLEKFSSGKICFGQPTRSQGKLSHGARAISATGRKVPNTQGLSFLFLSKAENARTCEFAVGGKVTYRVSGVRVEVVAGLNVGVPWRHLGHLGSM